MKKDIKIRTFPANAVALINDKIDFVNTAKPSITNYNTTWAATHGQYPNVRCMIMVDANIGYQAQLMPQFTYVGGLIDTIWFDLGTELTGYIILS